MDMPSGMVESTPSTAVALFPCVSIAGDVVVAVSQPRGDCDRGCEGSCGSRAWLPRGHVILVASIGGGKHYSVGIHADV